MSLEAQVSASLSGLRGFSSTTPKTMNWSTADGVELEIDFTNVDSLSCSFTEMRLSFPSLRNTPFDRLQAWGQQLCRRVSYLLERMAPLEADTEAQTVLIRSTPPSRQPDRTTFYEVLLQAPGYFSLRRYRRSPHDASRIAVDLNLTQEVLEKLIQDIVASVPAAPAAAPVA